MEIQSGDLILRNACRRIAWRENLQKPWFVSKWIQRTVTAEFQFNPIPGYGVNMFAHLLIRTHIQDQKKKQKTEPINFACSSSPPCQSLTGVDSEPSVAIAKNSDKFDSGSRDASRKLSYQSIWALSQTVSTWSTGWWYTYPSGKYEFVSWDYEISNIWKNHPNLPNHQPLISFNSHIN